MSIPIWCAAFCLYVTSFVQYMILKICMCHTCSKERRSGSHEATLNFHWWSPAPVFNAVGSPGGIPHCTETKHFHWKTSIMKMQINNKNIDWVSINKSPVCIPFLVIMFLLRHPQHLVILRRTIELHMTNNSSVYLKICLNLIRIQHVAICH